MLQIWKVFRNYFFHPAVSVLTWFSCAAIRKKKKKTTPKQKPKQTTQQMQTSVPSWCRSSASFWDLCVRMYGFVLSGGRLSKCFYEEALHLDLFTLLQCLLVFLYVNIAVMQLRFPQLWMSGKTCSHGAEGFSGTGGELSVVPGLLQKGYGVSKPVMRVHRLPHHPLKNLKLIFKS